MQALLHAAASSSCQRDEAATMTARADLLATVAAWVRSWGMTQGAAAARLGVTRPRLNDLLRGKAGKFSLDALVALAASAGLAVQVVVRDQSQA